MMRAAAVAVLAAVLSVVAAGGASAPPAPPVSLPPVQVDLDAPAPQSIQAYHLFKDFARQIPNEGVMPYGLRTPLFSDYATKNRFVWMPPGTSATYDGQNVFQFPIGTVLIKTFGYLNDIRDPSQGERLIETRLLIHTAKGWIGRPYVWNEAMTDARLSVAGSVIPLSWTHHDGAARSQNYVVPNVNECLRCHGSRGVMKPIGTKAFYLNGDHDYPEGVENQLIHWTEAGYLTGAPPEPADAPRAPVWDDPRSGTLDSRARAYLDINCAHCHRPGGVAFTSGLDLRYGQRTPVRYGVFKTPVAAGRGAVVGRYSIDPGHPDRSILLFRMVTTDPGMRMPVSGRSVTHDEGVALIRDWILSMESEASVDTGAQIEGNQP